MLSETLSQQLHLTPAVQDVWQQVLTMPLWDRHCSACPIGEEMKETDLSGHSLQHCWFLSCWAALFESFCIVFFAADGSYLVGWEGMTVFSGLKTGHWKTQTDQHLRAGGRCFQPGKQLMAKLDLGEIMRDLADAAWQQRGLCPHQRTWHRGALCWAWCFMGCNAVCWKPGAELISECLCALKMTQKSLLFLNV